MWAAARLWRSALFAVFAVSATPGAACNPPVPFRPERFAADNIYIGEVLTTSVETFGNGAAISVDIRPTRSLDGLFPTDTVHSRQLFVCEGSILPVRGSSYLFFARKTARGREIIRWIPLPTTIIQADIQAANRVAHRLVDRRRRFVRVGTAFAKTDPNYWLSAADRRDLKGVGERPRLVVMLDDRGGIEKCQSTSHASSPELVSRLCEIVRKRSTFIAPIVPEERRASVNFSW